MRKTQERQEERKGTRGPPRTPERHRGSAPDPAGGNDSPRAPSVCRAKAWGNAKALRRLAAVLGCSGSERGMPLAVCGPGGQAERGKFWKTARGCHLSVSVSCRTRSRRPTPSRPAPGRRVKGKDFKIRGALYVDLCFIRFPPLEKYVSKPGQAPVCP